MFDVAVFGSLFLTLFVIMDPPGITPIFLALTSGRPAKVQRRMAWQAVAVAFGVITVFGLLGQQILDYLHVSVPALMIAGGLLLLLIALDLLTGKTDEPTPSREEVRFVGAQIAATWLAERGRDRLAELLPGAPYLPGPVDQDLLVEAERLLSRSLRGHASLRRALRDGFWQHLKTQY
ncbi:hypothetical protein SNARM312S_00338 [Streptomyces narbonensis]